MIEQEGHDGHGWLTWILSPWSTYIAQNEINWPTFYVDGDKRNTSGLVPGNAGTNSDMTLIQKLPLTGLYSRVRTKNIIFLFLNQNMCYGYSKEPSQWDGSFEHAKHVKTDRYENIYNFTLKKFAYLNLCTQWKSQKGR